MEPFVVEAESLLAASLANNTWKAYETGMQTFEQFRMLHDLSLVWPPPVHHLSNFISYLSSTSYSPSTIRLYISGVSFSSRCRGLQDTTKNFLIQKMMTGAKNLYQKIDTRHPVTLDMLSKLPFALQNVCSSRYESMLFTAAFSLAFFGLLRVGEITVSSMMDKYKVIQNTDVYFSQTPLELQLTIRYSKTEQSGNSCVLRIGEENNLFVCPLHTLKSYLAIRPQFNGPLFCHFNKMPITRNQFVTMLHASLRFLGISCSKYNTHSFRIGGATHLFMSGASEATIKIKGRWSSDSFKRYIRC